MGADTEELVKKATKLSLAAFLVTLLLLLLILIAF